MMEIQPISNAGVSSPGMLSGSSRVVSFERRLSEDLNWAFEEADRFFQGYGCVKSTMARIVRRIERLDIPYALIGALALNAHGYRRFTEDVDLLVNRGDLHRIHDELEGSGFWRCTSRGRSLRDAESGVRVDFCVTGESPGDGASKAVVFPAPQDVSVVIDGIQVIQLSNLIELKLAAGMAPGRMRELGDVQETIKKLRLPACFREQLHPTVREAYDELWIDPNTIEEF